jgi:hypothetical protein
MKANALVAVARAVHRPGDIESLSLQQQAEALAEFAGLREQENADYTASQIGSSSDGLDELSEVQITATCRNDPAHTFVDAAAGVLDIGGKATEKMVKVLGGERQAAAAVFAVQAAIGGVPRAVASTVLGKLTGNWADKATDAISGLFQEHVFNGTGEEGSVKTVSDALAGFGVEAVLSRGTEGALRMVRSGRGYVAERSAQAVQKAFKRALAKEYRDKGLEIKPGSEAHHIIQKGNFPEEVKLLKDLGLDANDLDNGVFLPRKADGTSNGHRDLGMHSGDYRAPISRRFNGVLRNYSGAERTAMARVELNNIRRQMSEGTFVIIKQ